MFTISQKKAVPIQSDIQTRGSKQLSQLTGKTVADMEQMMEEEDMDEMEQEDEEDEPSRPPSPKLLRFVVDKQLRKFPQG